MQSLITRIDLIIAEVAILYAQTNDELENYHFGQTIEHLNEAANHLLRAQEKEEEL